MTTPHRTLQMALDALDAITDDVDGTGLNTMPSFDKAIDAIAALREALAADHLRDVAEKAAPAAPVVPLTDEQIEALPMWKRFVGLWPETRREIVRTIERHHGIKGGQHGTE